MKIRGAFAALFFLTLSAGEDFFEEGRRFNDNKKKNF
jgi:hypothetical protein